MDTSEVIGECDLNEKINSYNLAIFRILPDFQ